jgi:hypothetical protein
MDMATREIERLNERERAQDVQARSGLITLIELPVPNDLLGVGGPKGSAKQQ